MDIYNLETTVVEPINRVFEGEFSASEVRSIMQKLFPHRRLVLSQFTFFNQVGIAKPTGSSFRRGRRCYCLEDLLPIATVLALKEEGIPFKNISSLPRLVQNAAPAIFRNGPGCRLSAHGDRIDLKIPGTHQSESEAINSLLDGTNNSLIFWSFDIGLLAQQLQELTAQYLAGESEKEQAA